MSASVPSALAPYLQSCLKEGSTTLITSVLSTPANWLVLRTLESALSQARNNNDVHEGPTSTNDRSVIFLSLLHSYEFWLELGKKTGLDITSSIMKSKLAYIDGLTANLTVSQPAINLTKPKSHALIDLNSAITKAKSMSAQGSMSDGQTTLLIDGLDFVLASQPDVSADDLNTFIADLRERFSNVILAVSADAPLLHNTEIHATPLELEHSIFTRMIAHQSRWVLQLRPLETGHAKDVSGCIQISRGGANVPEDGSLLDGEWLFQVRGDGNVRVWSRGG